MDAATELLQATRLTGGVFLDARFTAPWCVHSGVTAEECAWLGYVPTHVIGYHYVSAGRMVLELDNHEPVVVEAGEIVMLPHNEPHRLASEPGLSPVNPEGFVEPGGDGVPGRLLYGGGGAETSMLCGFLTNELRNDPIIRVLPRVLKVNVRDAPTSAWIESTMRFGAQEIVSRPGRSPGLLARLAELLFVEAVRRFLASAPPGQSNWRAGICDPVVSRALALMHRRLDRRWTVEDLAREAGLSRSAFADRFVRLMGETPMRYLARQRLQLAAQRLEDASSTIAKIAFDAGYESESAFNRAFKREFGKPPAAWRESR